MADLDINLFHHPLAQPPRPCTINGEPDTFVDMYTACGFLLYAACIDRANLQANTNAMTMLNAGADGTSMNVEKLFRRCLRGDDVAIRQAIELMVRSTEISLDKSKAHGKPLRKVDVEFLG
ncbi:MAG: hypothetical protein DSM106950_03030 [Stigonema ocellatum SAG 48.90 = DSM 106950]|nr:hypothetical protein [Stigonema ocellatum SAG 48.90 = DSM 106950]